MGFPNVREARRERAALNKRYAQTLERAEKNGSGDSLANFEKRMRTTCAVINVGLSFLCSFLTNDKALYTTYRLGLKGQIRMAADPQNDRDRLTVEAKLFGSYGKEIRYAALSYDGSGPWSYGSYAMRLRDIAIRDRASPLEDNSYHFMEKHDVRVRGPLPAGYRAVWSERQKLAVCKLGHRLSSATAVTEYAKILMLSEGDYSTDSFIEVNIYGRFDASAVESVKGLSTGRGKDERAMLAIVRDVLNSWGRSWVEG